MIHLSFKYFQVKANVFRKKSFSDVEKRKILLKINKKNKKQAPYVYLFLKKKTRKNQSLSIQNSVCVLTGRPRGIINPYQLKRQIFKIVYMNNFVPNLEKKKL